MMNERFLELAKQVGLKARSESELSSQEQRFAELIVRECSQVSAHFSIENKRIHPGIDPRDMPEANRVVYHSTCQSIAGEIKQHFGVE